MASLSSSDIALNAPFLKYSVIYASYSAFALADSSLRCIIYSGVEPKFFIRVIQIRVYNFIILISILTFFLT